MNLRKDHCRNPPSRETREHVTTLEGGEGRGRAPDPPRRVRVAPPLAPGTKRTPARNASRKDNETIPAIEAPETVTLCLGGRFGIGFEYEERLSATDISALASMKNVAKCDTWCELQNPVNHRVFERKLRPKPSGRGHVCLGVTRRCPPTRTPPPPPAGRGETVGAADDDFPRALRPAVGPKIESPVTSSWQQVVDHSVPPPRASDTHRDSDGPPMRPSRVPPTRPQVRRGYPLSLSISISGGKETYEDSPSNGERTGKSPG